MPPAARSFSPHTQAEVEPARSCSTSQASPLTSKGSRRRGGVTLLEIVVVVAIITILTSMGVWLSSDLLPRWRARQAAMEFASHIQECRARAVESSRECMVWLIDCDSDISSSCGATGGEYWIAVGNHSSASDTWDYLPFDSESDGTDDDTSQGVVDFGDKTTSHYLRNVGMDYWGSSIGGPDVGNSDRIVFSPRGFVSNPSSDFDILGYITITFVNKLADKKGMNEAWTVSITRSGMTRIDSTYTSEYGGLVSGTTMSTTDS